MKTFFKKLSNNTKKIEENFARVLALVGIVVVLEKTGANIENKIQKNYEELMRTYEEIEKELKRIPTTKYQQEQDVTQEFVDKWRIQLEDMLYQRQSLFSNLNSLTAVRQMSGLDLTKMETLTSLRVAQDVVRRLKRAYRKNEYEGVFETIWQSISENQRNVLIFKAYVNCREQVDQVFPHLFPVSSEALTVSPISTCPSSEARRKFNDPASQPDGPEILAELPSPSNQLPWPEISTPYEIDFWSFLLFLLTSINSWF